MKKHFRCILSAIAACAVMTSVFTDVGVRAVEDSSDTTTVEVGGDDITAKAYTEMCTGNIGDFSYTMWKDPDSGKASFIPEEDGSFECSWSDTEEPEFTVGTTMKNCIVNSNVRNYEQSNRDYDGAYPYYIYSEGSKTGTESLTLDYEADIDSEDDYFFGGMCTASGDPDQNSMTILVGESYSGMDFLKNRNHIGEITINDVAYDIYDGAVTVRDIENYDPHLFPKSQSVYWIMRKEPKNSDEKISGTIDFGGIINAFNAFRNRYNFFYYISDPALCVRGLGSGSGSVKITKNDVNIGYYPDEELKNGETVSRGDTVWSLEQNDKTDGKATVCSNGSLKYEWANDNEDAYCFIKASVKADDRFIIDSNSSILGTSAFVTSYDEQTPDKYAVGFCGTIGTPNVEYYIIDSCRNADILKNAEYIETIFTGFRTYSIYIEKTDIDTEYGKVIRFFSVSRDGSPASFYDRQFDCDLKEHILMWKAYGLKEDNVLEMNSFAEISGRNAGSLSLKIPFIFHDNDCPSYKYNFESFINTLSPYDLDVLQQYLLGNEFLPSNINYDFNDDEVIDVYDLIKLRKLLARKEEGLPWSLDPDINDESYVSHESDSYYNWSWGQSYYSEGSIEAVADEKNITGQWDNSESAFFYERIHNNALYTIEEPDYNRYIKYEYTADSDGPFLVGAEIQLSEQRNSPIITEKIYIAESYDKLAFLDEAAANGDAKVLGTINTSDDTEYTVILNYAAMGTEIFVLRNEPKPLASQVSGTLYYDDILKQLPELVPDISRKFITVSFGSKCFGTSRGYYKSKPITDEREVYDYYYYY